MQVWRSGFINMRCFSRYFSSTAWKFNVHDTKVSQPTIYALSTSPGKAAVAVIRVSGSQSEYVLKSLTENKTLPVPRRATLRKLYGGKRKLLDHALVLLFKGPKSFTGEDLLELHLHGGVATIRSVLSAIKSLNDNENQRLIRYAEPGEFTRRAFQNNQFDLTESEGIRDMIDAETESQRVAAINSMEGYNKKYFTNLREQIVHNSAMLSALIDFGDDYNLEEVDKLMGSVAKNVDGLRKDVLKYLQKTQKTKILLNGIKMTLLGPTNAGKSSLLNQIADKEAAIVSNIAGTTRDIINFPLDINGYKVVIGDTAGIRNIENASDAIEIEGIKRAKVKASESDIVLVVLPANIDQIDDAFISFVNELRTELKKPVKLIINKVDLIGNDSGERIAALLSKNFNLSCENVQLVSCVTKQGIEQLINKLTNEFKVLTESEDSDPISLSERSQDIILNDILYGFDEFERAREMEDVVLASEALKLSIDGIGKITGDTVGVEEILGVIFSTFCIGK